MILEFFSERRPHRGMTPAEYRQYFEMESAKARLAGSAAETERERYLPLNLQRTIRIEKTHVPSRKLQAAMRALEDPQLWMVLTEPWCGDSAQNLPYITRMAACNSSFDLRILLRDQNLEIVDQYLTDGTRGIPKLVAFDPQGNELFRWGPRPQPAVELFRQLRAVGTPTEDLRRKLHLWYARNHGRALEGEFCKILNIGADHFSQSTS